MVTTVGERKGQRIEDAAEGLGSELLESVRERDCFREITGSKLAGEEVELITQNRGKTRLHNCRMWAGWMLTRKASEQARQMVRPCRKTPARRDDPTAIGA